MAASVADSHVVDMDERPHAGACADNRKTALANRLDELPGGGDVSSRPVKPAIPQDRADKPVAAEHGIFEMTDRLDGAAELRRRIGVERIVLVFDHRADAGIGPAGKALRDDPADACGASGCDQNVGPFGAQPVGRRKLPVEMPQIAKRGERGQLVNDDFGRRRRDRPHHRGAVERIGHDRLDPGGTQRTGFCLGPRHADDRVPGPQQQRDEPPTDGPGSAGDEQPHHTFLSRSSVA